jgi:undecaprenyl-diphosphatase
MNFNRLDTLERAVCITINRACNRRYIKRFFAAVSRIGDGIVWYVLMAILPLLFGLSALFVTLHMVIVGVLCVASYKFLKKKLVRQRPYIKHDRIQLGANPLDVHSFPSGHTLHAVAFTVIAIHYFPILAVVLLPFSMLVAMSRVILGLHYPSDVIVGAILGYTIAQGTLYFASTI